MRVNPFSKNQTEWGSISSNISGDETLEDLVGRDTDGDGILDWEEGLWGTDPNKKDTKDDGIPDNVEIERMKSATGSTLPGGPASEENNLTETDKFSRELFSTVATLNQTGGLDQSSVDKLSDSLAEQIQNSTQKKVFSLSDLKIIDKNDSRTIQNYNKEAGAVLYKKYPINEKIINILKESLTENSEIDSSILSKLDPIIKQIEEVIAGMIKISVPSKIAVLHLDLINVFEKIAESLRDIKLVDTDPIVAIGAISQYPKNNDQLELILGKLATAINNAK